MNILFVVAYTPNLIRVRPYQFIRALVDRGHRLTVATVTTSEEEREDVKHVQKMGVQVITADVPRLRTAQNLVRALFTRAPLQAFWSWQPALLARMTETLAQQKFDAIHVEHLRGSRYALSLQDLVAKGKTLGNPPVVWDSVDSISALFAQAQRLSPSLKTKVMTTLEQGKTRREEGRLASSFPRVIVTSERDGDVLVELAKAQGEKRGMAAEEAIRVIPNGVDTAAFPFTSQEEREPATLVFSGKMSYHANAAAARHLMNEIMPLVWQQKPETSLWLVGKDPGPEMVGWAQRHGDRVRVTGAVPDMGKALGKATLSVAPLVYGAGIQNKVLEAMACGTPVVATPLAVSALQAEQDVDLVVADGAPAIASAICSLLDDPHRRESLAQAGRAYVERLHSWNAAAALLEQAYREAAESTRQ